MRSKAPLGELELEVLRYIADRPSATVGEVAEGFGVPRQLARTTVQTVMERLYKKGYLNRKDEANILRYSARTPQADLLRGLVGDFVEKTLAGSLSPLMAYLSEAETVTPEEMAELKAVVAKLQAKQEPEA